MSEETFDYVIVGAGSAGCVLAARLSEVGANKVLVLEAGPEDRNPLIRVPAAFPMLFQSAIDWADRTVPQPALSNRRIYWPRGRVIGGSSSLNAMMWVRGLPADYDRWAELAGPSWSYRSVLPYFRRAEGVEVEAAADGGQAGGSDPPARPELGRSGPIPVRRLRDPNPLTASWIAAARRCGVPAAPVPNAGHREGVGEALVTQRRGRRVSAADAYLDPARRRRNLEVRTKARVLAVRVVSGRAAGVVYRRGRERTTVLARREVVLAAGAVGTPQLLMCSGIGPGAMLSAEGIEVVADVPGVGQNLQDHLVAGLALSTRRPVTLAKARRAGELARFAFQRRGMLTSNVLEGYGLVRSGPGLDQPDIELGFVPALFLDEGLTLPREHGVSLAAVLLQPASRGEVRLAGPDVETPPAIDPRYLSDPGGDDAATLSSGVRLCLAIARTPPLSEELGATVAPAGIARDDGELVERAVRDLAQTLYHPVGTCRMGTDAGSVVDPQLRLRAVASLRIADASVMPSIVRGHTHAPTVMVAERAADLMLGRLGAT